MGLNYIHRLLYLEWFVSAICAIKTLQSEDKGMEGLKYVNICGGLEMRQKSSQQGQSRK